MGIEKGTIIKGRYRVKSKLGDGCYAKVYLVEDLRDKGRLYGIKVTNKRHFKRNRELGPNLAREVRIHKTLNHPNILKFYQEFDDDQYKYFLLEFVRKGELFDILYDKYDDSDMTSDSEIDDNDKDKPFSEKVTRHYMKQLVSGLKYLRDRNVVHRDLKPENLLVDSGDNDDSDIIKICDFGWACEGKSRSCVGTCEYNAPEMVRQKYYDYRSDIWSLGVLMFEFLYRKRPFKGHSDRDTERKIMRGRVEFPKKPEISNEAKDLILKMLVVNPDNRWDYEQIMSHPWLLKVDPEESIQGVSLRSMEDFDGNSGDEDGENLGRFEC